MVLTQNFATDVLGNATVEKEVSSVMKNLFDPGS